MSQNKYSTEGKKYKQLTVTQRGQIEILRREKYSQRRIAELVGVSQGSISREIARNSVEQMDSELRMKKKYYGDAAQRQRNERMERSGARHKYLLYPEIIERIEKDVLERKWSPDASVGRMERESGKRSPISARSFYNYVDMGVVKVKPLDLAQKTRRRQRPRKRPEGKKRTDGRSIEERPKSAEKRQEFGHWEIDGVIGKATDQTELMTLVERKTRKGIVIMMRERTQEAVCDALHKLERKYGQQFPDVFKSITSDNGSEFLNWRKMERSRYKNRRIRTQCYYAHPYRASERGSNEQYNGLLRRFIPKGISIDTIAEKRVARAAEWTNTLPRRILGYQTAEEAFAAELAALG